jgi:hypothetical protein
MKEHFGYSEPLRRFIQRESFEPQANEIPNDMPSWLPGDDYMTNFKVGDPYVRVDDGYARLPGAGYEALHPELQGVNPEDYPDINKLSILADVAPYSREYNLYRQKVASQARNNTERWRQSLGRASSSDSPLIWGRSAFVPNLAMPYWPAQVNDSVPELGLKADAPW